KEPEWEKYINSLKSNKETEGVNIGILSYNNDPALIQKYLMDVGVRGGFIQLKLGVKQSTDIILKVLEANEAKGRRKFVRANCENDPRVVMNFSYKESSYEGKILDLSSVGIACEFPSPIPIDNKTVISKIQLNLRGSLVQADAIILSRRYDSDKILVLVFNPRPKEAELEKIHNFIHKTLQKTIAGY
ncbi:MAG: PilZ domain-containing protein, partial [Spirochaetota bacterium]|nr:PilZ domain-containing protein [Spirochaetota bacterium]